MLVASDLLLVIAGREPLPGRFHKDTGFSLMIKRLLPPAPAAGWLARRCATGGR